MHECEHAYTVTCHEWLHIFMHYEVPCARLWLSQHTVALRSMAHLHCSTQAVQVAVCSLGCLLHVRAVARVLAWLPSCSSRRSRHVRAVARQTSLVRDFVQPCNSDRLDNSHIDRPVGLFLNLVQLAHIQHVCFCSALHFGSARELASQSPTPRVRTSIACGVIVLLAMDRTQPPNNFLLVAVTL